MKLLLSPASEAFVVVCDGVVLPVFWFGVLFDVEVVVASDSSRDSSNDSSSPAEFVTVNGGQENLESSDGLASTISVMETVTVTELVIVYWPTFPVVPRGCLGNLKSSRRMQSKLDNGN